MAALGNGVETAMLLCDRFLNEYQSIVCPGIQTKLFGRAYHLIEPEEFKKFEEAGGHSDATKCIRVVGNSARWTLEILLDKGIVSLSQD